MEQELKLTIRNVTAAPVAFKVKTTAPQRYMVKPTQDVLGAHESKECVVVMTRLTEMPDVSNPKKLKDKFRVQSVAVPASADVDLTAMWKEMERKDGGAGFQISKVAVKLSVPAEEQAAVASVPEEGTAEAEGDATATPADGGGAGTAAADATAAAADAAAAAADKENEARRRQQQAEADAAVAAAADAVAAAAAAAKKAEEEAGTVRVAEDELAALRRKSAEYDQTVEAAAVATKKLEEASRELASTLRLNGELAAEVKTLREDVKHKALEVSQLETSIREAAEAEETAALRRRKAAGAEDGAGAAAGPDTGAAAQAQAVADPKSIRLSTTQLAILCVLFLLVGFVISP